MAQKCSAEGVERVVSEALRGRGVVGLDRANA